MAVFRVEKTKDLPPSTQREIVAKGEGAFIPHALVAGRLGLYHERSCLYL